MSFRALIPALCLLLACEAGQDIPAEPPPAASIPPVAAQPSGALPPPVAHPGERPPPEGHDAGPPPPVLEAGEHPFGEIFGIDASLAVQPDSPDLHYPLDKLWRMAGSARDVNRKPDQVMALLKVQPGDVVADVGAGSGYHTWHLSEAVGAEGEVWATEIQLDSHEFMKQPMPPPPPPHTHAQLLLRDRRDVLIPTDSISLALLVNVHFFAYPKGPPMKEQSLPEVVAFYRSIHRALEPGGRMVILEHQADFERKPEGSITAEGITEQVGQAGFVLTAQHQPIPGEYFLVYEAR